MYGILDVMVNLLTSLLNLNRNMKGGERGSRNFALYMSIYLQLLLLSMCKLLIKTILSKQKKDLCHKSSCQMQSKGQGYYQRFWGSEYCVCISVGLV